MPNKPIKQGYKIFTLAEHSYIWTFSWSSCQLGIEEMFKWPGLTPTVTDHGVLELMRHSLGTWSYWLQKEQSSFAPIRANIAAAIIAMIMTIIVRAIIAMIYYSYYNVFKSMYYLIEGFL
jgi:hypothetical protein